MDIEQVQKEAAAEVEAIITAAMAAISAPKPKQAELRAAFDRARQEAGGIESFEAEFGLTEAIKQGLLLLRREEGN